MRTALRAVLTLGIAFSSKPSLAAERPLSEAISKGNTQFHARLRGEFVEQDNALEDAAAGTLRLRLGYTTGQWHSLIGHLEYEGTHALGSEAYNSLRNGNTGRSVVPDPDGDELNQAWIAWRGLPDTELRIGRSRLILDNARYVGNVGWRQNEQTYDAYILEHQGIDGLKLTLAQITNANNILFSNRPMNTQLLHLRYTASASLQLSGYHYRIDFDNSAADHQTSGIQARGAISMGSWSLPWTAELAQQSEHGEASSFKLPYSMFSFGLSKKHIGLQLSHETLGNDQGASFSTPLATLHAHNGWADQFLVTPANGLRDLSLKLHGTTRGLSWAVIAHDFSADSGGADYGRELDLLLSRHLTGQLLGTVKYAHFDVSPNSGMVRTQKLWAQLEYGF